MTRSQFTQWLDAFGKAWQTNAAEDIGALVADDFEWRSGAFAEIFRDRSTLVDHWISVGSAHSEVQPSYEILSVHDGLGICEYFVTHLQHKTATTKGAGVFLVRLDESERCTYFMEYYKSATAPHKEYL